MASTADENSPPRQDPLSKARRQSTLLDSPSRVTRSQLRRLSSAPAEAPMSPRPTTRRRSTVAPGNKNDADDQDEVSSVQEETDAVKALPRRRSVRKSFADSTEEGPLSGRPSKLTSIEEQSAPVEESRPVTRRTRASMASSRAPLEPEPELCLPTTRRTRRSSMSSVASSVVASPKRQTRSRKNLSPVASPTCSEFSTMSEVPETSPATKSSPSKDDSPKSKKSDNVLGTPRQLQLNNSESTKTRRSPFVVSDKVQGEEVSSPSEAAEMENSPSMRRSYRKQSLKSPLQFEESAMEDNVKLNLDQEKLDNECNAEVEFNKPRSSLGRLSLSSNKSRLSLSSNKSSPMKSETASPGGVSKVTQDHTDSPAQKLNRSQRESTGRLSRKSSPFKFNVSDNMSPEKLQLEVSSFETTSFETNTSTTDDTSQEVLPNGNVSFEQNKLDTSKRSSTGRISMGKSPSLKAQEMPEDKSSNEDSSVTDEVNAVQQVFDVDDTSTDPSLIEVVVEKRNSVGRLSLPSNRGTPEKRQGSDSSPIVSNVEVKGRFSLSSNKSTPAKSPKCDNSEVSNADSQRPSLGRFSLSSSKSTPSKSPKTDTPTKSPKTNTPIKSPTVSLTRFVPALENVQKCDTPKLTNDEPSNTVLSRFSLSSNKSTPAKASPAKSPRGEKTPQSQINESSRNSIGRMSLSSVKSPFSGVLGACESDNEESDSVSSSSPSGHNESMGKLNVSSNHETSPKKPTARLSLTPSKSLNNSQHQEEGVSNDANASEDSSDVSNKDSDDGGDEASDDAHKMDKFFNLMNRSDISRRASTGNLSSEPLKSNLKKARASMGPLINPLTSYITCADKSEDGDDSSHSSMDVSIEDNLNVTGDKEDFGAGELTLSPIKQAAVSQKRSLTPSDKSCSERDQLKSPNNPFEKSTVFNDDSFASNAESNKQALEMSVGSHNSSMSGNSGMNRSSANDQSAELNSSKRRSLKSPANDVSEEENNLVCLASSNVDEERGSSRVYKSAAILMTGGKVSDFDEDDSDDGQWQTVFSPSTLSKKELRLEKKARKKAEKEERMKRKQERHLKYNAAESKSHVATEDEENPANEESSILSPSSGKSKKRKSMEANLASVEALEGELDTSEKKNEENVLSAKKTKKRKSEMFGFESAANDHEAIDALETTPVVEGQDVQTTNKKKKKKAKATAEMQLVEINPDKKKKLKKKVVENGMPVEEISLKKKKKQKLAGEDQPVEEISRKKKKKVPTEDHPEEEMSLKKKKKKKLISENEPAGEITTENLKIKKKKKKNQDLVLQPSTAFEQNSKDLVADKVKEKKSKKKDKVVVEPSAHASDSDDEPTAVSFAAGKSSALALMGAAAESIRKQKELKKQKIKIRQEKFKEEKAAKMKKLKHKRNVFDVESSSTATAELPLSKSLKIYFDDNGQKVKQPKRLPTELLESLSEQPPTKLVKRADGSKERMTKSAALTEEMKQMELMRAKKLARKLEKQKLLQSEYVPLEGVLGATRFGVVPLRNVMLAKKLEKNKLAEDAANFRQQSLFGNRIRRTPISAAISYQEKLKASGKDKIVKK